MCVCVLPYSVVHARHCEVGCQVGGVRRAHDEREEPPASHDDPQSHRTHHSIPTYTHRNTSTKSILPSARLTDTRSGIRPGPCQGPRGRRHHSSWERRSITASRETASNHNLLGLKGFPGNLPDHNRCSWVLCVFRLQHVCLKCVWMHL